MLFFLELIPYIIIFIFGITIGSFLNVCIYRIPLGESIVTAPSHCMTCGRKLKWYDMVPVFSWLVLGGKCRNCKSKISVQYPIIEGVNGILYVMICAVNGLEWSSVIYCFMASALLVLSIIDWRTYEIPFGINVFLFVLGIAMTILDRGNLVEHLIGMICVSGLLGILYLLTGGRAIGGGDIKLMFACGLILGWKLILLAFFPGMYYWLSGSYHSYVCKESRTYACNGSISVSGNSAGCFMGECVDQLVSVITGTVKFQLEIERFFS